MAPMTPKPATSCLKIVIPPRSNAGYWSKGHIRNEAVDALKAGNLSDWKQRHHYGKRSLAETAMYRYKQLISPPLTLRDYNAQVGEALAGVKTMNKRPWGSCYPRNDLINNAVLTPKQHSTGGWERIGHISKSCADKRLRSLLYQGAMSVVQKVTRRERER